MKNSRIYSTHNHKSKIAKARVTGHHDNQLTPSEKKMAEPRDIKHETGHRLLNK